MAVGSDETIDIAIRARYEGINKAIDELKRLGSQLTAIDKQLRSGLNSDALNKQFAETARQFDKVAQSVKRGSADSSKSIATVTAQVERLNAEMKKAQEKADAEKAAAEKAAKDSINNRKRGFLKKLLRGKDQP
jgi:methyl-accepting chemotaxis protein